jgi:hypothetical protein
MNGSAIALLTSTPGQGWVGDWSPGIGDPTITGWVTVVAYFVGSYLCWLAFRVERVRRGRPGNGPSAFLNGLGILFRGLRKRGPGVPAQDKVPALWAGLALMLLLLGLNKQLDLQTLFTDIGRLMAKDEGWYADRRFFQLVFIVALACAGVVVMRGLWRFARGHLRDMRLALMGAVGLTCFVAIRAASFHHFDIFIGSEVAGLTFNAILEIGAISLICVGAARQIFGLAAAPEPVRATRAAESARGAGPAQAIYTPPPRPPARKR